MDNNIKFICPICGEDLTLQGKSMCCKCHHTFDIAKQGYVNLLPVQNKHSLHPGDTKEMLLARRSFLDSEFYTPITNSVTDCVKERLQNIHQPVILDIGCGEGYYTSKISDCVGNASSVCGIDISKDGIKMACSRSKDIKWAVATAAVLPIETDSAHLITAMFSLVSPCEFSRVLKSGGYVIEVTAGDKHLYQLKEIIYDTVYPQHKAFTDTTAFFTDESTAEHTFDFTLENKDLVNLLKMTPHYWRIKEERRIQLESTPKLTLTADYRVRVLKRK